MRARRHIAAAAALLPLLALAAAIGSAAAAPPLPAPAAAAAAAAADGDCPVAYSLDRASVPGGLLLGGVLDAGVNCTTTANGQPCPRLADKERDGFWNEECRFLPSSKAFAVADEQQRAEALTFARRLHDGAPLAFSPCDLWPYLRGRTLWLIGDSHTKQLFRALQCFLYDFWDGQECKAAADEALVRDLDNLPAMPGESKCIHLAGNSRVCRLGVVLGSSLAGNAALPEGGVLGMLRNKGLASPGDVLVIQFGLWHLLEGPPGFDKYKAALLTLGEYLNSTRGEWPVHAIYRDTPMRHDKDAAAGACRAAPPGGWSFDDAAGEVVVADPAASNFAATAARGGALGAAAREVLAPFGVPVMGGFGYSVPLHRGHVHFRGVTDLDCIHYAHRGLPELLVYELWRSFEAGLAGVAPMPAAAAAADPAQRRACVPIGAAYRR